MFKNQQVQVKLAGGWVPARVYGLDTNNPAQRVWVKLATGCQNIVPVDVDRVKEIAPLPTIDDIKMKLTKSPRWVRRALVVLFERQTADEQAGEHTGELNGRGFSKFDAPALSCLAKRVLRGDELTSDEIAFAGRRLQRYAGQLQRIAQAKAEEEAEEQPPVDEEALRNAANSRYLAERARVHGVVGAMMN